MISIFQFIYILFIFNFLYNIINYMILSILIYLFIYFNFLINIINIIIVDMDESILRIHDKLRNQLHF